jgi:hypothetical protein
MAKLVDVSLMELSKGEYALATMMPTKKDIFGNWIIRHMCGDYHPMYKWTHLNKYVMPLLEEVFDALRRPRFSIPWT